MLREDVRAACTTSELPHRTATSPTCLSMDISTSSAIPSFFRGRKYNGRLALRRGESRVTSLEARVRRLQLSERGRAMLNAGPWSCPFAPHEGQKAWKSGRSQNEGIPEP